MDIAVSVGALVGGLLIGYVWGYEQGWKDARYEQLIAQWRAWRSKQ